ncbi:MAG: MFS transporter, partial [Gammaproteobacteria bacterium]
MKPLKSTDSHKDKSSYKAWVLFMLLVVYIFNFIDRQIIGILAVPIQAELSLSDTQLSLMGGLAFALFYTALGIPIAWLADRKNRTWIITIALMMWSLMTALCGLAQNFAQLFLARLGVGVGEAGGVAPSYSLISDYFPSNQRSRALGIYAFAIPIGSALGMLIGGVLINLIGWRLTFIVVGILGLAIAPLFKLTVKEPKRGKYDSTTSDITAVPFSTVIQILKKKKSFWFLSLGGASASMMTYGLLFWFPSFLVRSFDAELITFFSWLPSFMLPTDPSPVLFVSYFYGIILLVGGIAGIWLGAVVSDKLGETDKTIYGRAPAYSFIATIPFFLIGILSNSLIIVFFSFMIIQALSFVMMGPLVSSLQHIVGPNMRATTSAIALFINNLVGIGLGNLLIGILSDVLSAQFAEEALRYSIASGVIFYIFAAIFF